MKVDMRTGGGLARYDDPGRPPAGAPGPPATAAARILLVEPQFVLRRTIVAVGRDLGLGNFREATSVENAQPLLSGEAFDGLVLDIGIGERAIQLLDRLRAGVYRSAADIPVVALTTAEADAAPAGRLRAFALLRILHKPFKVADLLQTIQQMPVRRGAVAG